jgi:hypothetical protein
MRKLFVVAALAIVLITLRIESFAQLDMLFAPFDCREHAGLFHEAAVGTEEVILIDSTLLTPETIITFDFDTVNGWKTWSVVENFSFGKDRGTLTMITDLNALHPFFREKVSQLIAKCKKQGIELAVVETYRTHAKQNEYRSMGRKYTNSKGGKSKHQYGLAVDVVPMVDGVAVWDNLQLWRKVGVMGEKLGLRWGGRWKKPYDPGHFEWTGGLTSGHLAAGVFPPIPHEEYPCIHEDLSILKKYWKQWEDLQEQTLSSKGASATEKTF